MGKVGSIFRDARLGKGLTLDQVADETNISKRFLQGIESDSYDGFPGEVYALGFIRNYAEFLGLDAKKMVEIYHSAETPDQGPEALATSEEIQNQESTREPEQASEPDQSSVHDMPAPSELPPGEHEDTQTLPLFPEEDLEPLDNKSPARDAPYPRKKSPKNPKKQKESAIAEIEKTSKNLAPAEKEISTPNLLTQGVSISKEKRSHIQVGRFIPLALVVVVVIIAVVSILPMLKDHSTPNRRAAEYHAEGLPFEQRLYPHDKVFLPLGNDFVAVTLTSIKDKVTFDTPYGTLNAGLNEDVVINPSSESERLTASVLDYAPNEPQNGANVRFDAKEALASSDQQRNITIAADTQKNQGVPSPAPQTAPTQGSPEVLFRSPGGAHPFYVNISFMAPVLFRYEADKKEWVEKYYRKGESITVNASNSITFWTANAQAVKVNVFQSAGKSAELVMGGAGEIAVKRLFWSDAQGGWALVADSLD